MQKSFQLGLRGVWVIGDSIKALFSPVECETCKLLKEFLEYEQEKREYYEKLLLTKAGILHDNNETALDLENFPTVRRATTLSMIRKMAAQASSNRVKDKRESVDRFESAVSAKVSNS